MGIVFLFGISWGRKCKLDGKFTKKEIFDEECEANSGTKFPR